MQEQSAGEIDRRLLALVEDADLGAVADADDVTVDDHLIAGSEGADLVLARRKSELVRGHYWCPFR